MSKESKLIDEVDSYIETAYQHLHDKDLDLDTVGVTAQLMIAQLLSVHVKQQAKQVKMIEHIFHKMKN